jgi:hypothetical protein
MRTKVVYILDPVPKITPSISQRRVFGKDGLKPSQYKWLSKSLYWEPSHGQATTAQIDPTRMSI